MFTMKTAVRYSLLMILMVIGFALSDVVICSDNGLTIAWNGVEDFFKVFAYPVLIILILG